MADQSDEDSVERLSLLTDDQSAMTSIELKETNGHFLNNNNDASQEMLPTKDKDKDESQEMLSTKDKEKDASREMLPTKDKDKDASQEMLPTKDNNEIQPPFTKRTLVKNVAVGCLGFLFLFTAFQSISNLQTSLNREEGIGSISLSLVYASIIISCLLPKFLIARLGCKKTMAISMMGYVLYIAANFYAVKATMFIAAIFVGIGAAPLWTAQFAYLTQCSVWYAKITNQDKKIVISRFMGIFWFISKTSQVWGNLVASTVFTPPVDESALEKTACGAHFCQSGGGGNVSSSFKQDKDKVYTALGIYVACSVIGFLIVVFLLDPITLDCDNKNNGEDNKKLNPKLLLATFKHLIRSPTQQMLVPITIYTGVAKAFLGGEYTKGYITCSLGIWNLGYVMICYGVFGALFSFIYGHLAKYTGRIPLFCLLIIIHGPVQIALLLWHPSRDQEILFYVFAGLWAMGDAVLQTQLNALYGDVFAENTEAGFSNFRMWEAVGFAVAYAYNDALCTDIKLYICMAMLCVGMAGYGAVETSHRLEKRRKKEEVVQVKDES